MGAAWVRQSSLIRETNGENLHQDNATTCQNLIRPVLDPENGKAPPRGQALRRRCTPQERWKTQNHAASQRETDPAVADIKLAH